MAEEKKDALSERVARRRAQLELEQAQKAQAKQPTNLAPSQKFPTETGSAATTPPTDKFPTETAPIVSAATSPAQKFPSETTVEFPTETAIPLPAVTEAMQAINSGANPMEVARRLSATLAAGMSRKELLGQIKKSDAWLSKRLALLKAPIDIQRLIESGKLSENEYHDNRANVKAGVRGRGDTLRYQRMPTVTIGIEAARALGSILQYLADKQGAAPVRLDANASKKDLTNILNLRAGELWGGLGE